MSGAWDRSSARFTVEPPIASQPRTAREHSPGRHTIHSTGGAPARAHTHTPVGTAPHAARCRPALRLPAAPGLPTEQRATAAPRRPGRDTPPRAAPPHGAQTNQPPPAVPGGGSSRTGGPRGNVHPTPGEAKRMRDRVSFKYGSTGHAHFRSQQQLTTGRRVSGFLTGQVAGRRLFQNAMSEATQGMDEEQF